MADEIKHEFVPRKPDWIGNIPVSLWVNKEPSGKLSMNIVIGTGLKFKMVKNEIEEPELILS